MIMKLERQRRRTGTIARLPREARDQVNKMLDDGCPYGKIVEWLAANGHPGVHPDEVGEWKQGGFQDWLEIDMELARQEKTRELSYEIATANEGSRTQEAAIQIAANFLFEVFRKFDPEKLEQALNLKPQQVTAVLNAFSRISRRGSEVEMMKEFKRLQEERRREAAEVKVIPAVQPGLSDEGEERVERDYNLT